MAKVSQVFVAGGQPTVTYNPRTHLNLDKSIREYLATLFKILSVSGATKSGKTVLVRTILPADKAIWVSGGNIESAKVFWEHVIEQLEAFTQVTETQSDSQGGVSSEDLEGQFKPWGLGLSSKRVDGKNWTNTDTSTKTRTVSASVIGPRVLKDKKIPVVIDDFHYIDPKVQGEIVRGLKEPVFDGVPVILISVPHRAFDSVRVEREMTGRVMQLQVPSWTKDDLFQIAIDGFAALNVSTETEVLNRLAQESFASPHLMQDFCGQVCRDNGIYETKQGETAILQVPVWDAFFRKQAAGTAKSAFDRLAIGPRQRTDRIERKLKNGKTGDIYVAVLLAIAHTGPKPQLSYEEIRAALRDILEDSLPQAHEITRVLDQMSKIAHEEIEGEPVVDWDKQYSKLHVSDPFFAYYLRWGTQLPRTESQS